MKKTVSARSVVGLSSLLALASACSGDVVDLGGGNIAQNLSPGGRCAESPVLDADVAITNQAELEELAGCEEIRGDLLVYIFEGADLTPLSSLRSVGGSLTLGESPLFLSFEAGGDYSEEEALRVDALFERGWLESLAGLENLESVGNLYLVGIGAPDLQALSQLRVVTGAGGFGVGGTMFVDRARHLRDLSGLEGAEGISNVSVSSSALESLDGLVLAGDIDGLFLDRCPALVDIDALAGVTSMSNGLFVRETGLEDLSGLSALAHAGQGAAFSGNPALADASGLNALAVADYLVFEDNDALLALPSFQQTAALNGIHIVGNDALLEVNLDMPDLQPAQFITLLFGPDELSTLSADRIEIQGNASLTRVTSPAGFTAAQYLTIEGNPSLTELDLASIERLDFMAIKQNATLASVNLPALQTVDSLEVTGNPLLTLEAFANVRTFYSNISDNAVEP